MERIGIAFAHYWLGRMLLRSEESKQVGIIHLAVARCLKDRLQFLDCPEIEKRTEAEEIPLAIKEKAEEMAIGVLERLKADTGA